MAKKKTDWALRAEEAAVAAARENAQHVDCLPGAYEDSHLDWSEYAESNAAFELGEQIRAELDALDALDASYAYELETRKRAITKVVDREFFHAYVRELRKLRPDLRECGDDGEEEAGMRGFDEELRSGLRDDVVGAMASMMFNLAYADAWEDAFNEGEVDEKPPRHFDFPAPEEITEGCEEILTHALAGADIATVVKRYAEESSGRGTPEMLGHDLACDWLGHGCSDSGMDLGDIGLKLGHGELNFWPVDGSMEKVEVGFFAGTGLPAERYRRGGASMNGPSRRRTR